ncbi:MAG: hypothetical protein ABIK28_19130 [Planctomycetota bacterium]
MLLFDRFMPMASAIIVDRSLGPTHSRTLRFLTHMPARTFAVPTPVYGKSKKIEGIRSLPILLPVWGTKIDEAGLFRMKSKVVPLQPLPENRHHPLRVFHVFEAEKKVSSAGESHPHALSEPCMNVSAHTAPIIQPKV